jgi:gag-polyprotein putative aspartyl protease
VEGLLNSSLKVQVLFDWGADETCISHKHVSRLINFRVAVNLDALEAPYNLGVSFGGGSVRVEQMARLHLVLTTHAGKLQLRNIQAFVIRDETLEDLILGRPLLESIGLDLNKHLVELTKENLVLDCSDDVPVNKGKVSMLMSDQVVDDDIQAAKLNDNIVEIGEDANTEISEAFSLMVTKAIAKGLPEEFFAPMRSLLKEFRDIWRLRLGPDSSFQLNQ